MPPVVELFVIAKSKIPAKPDNGAPAEAWSKFAEARERSAVWTITIDTDDYEKVQDLLSDDRHSAWDGVPMLGAAALQFIKDSCRALRLPVPRNLSNRILARARYVFLIDNW